MGFVPTMGALHEGHLDLVHRALSDGHRVVCSIYVNPLQFNDPNDLANYPRTMERDRELLEGAGCHALFAPEGTDLFAGFSPALYALHGLDDHWEGPSRPGHFQGVVNVVERLFHYVRPDAAYFGEKDRQQLTILQRVAADLWWPETIVPCPTVRAADGLALSSRNARLDAGQRQQATVLFQALQAMKALPPGATAAEALAEGDRVLATRPEVRTDHLGLAHADTLVPLPPDAPIAGAVALIAAHVGPVRLIDNLVL